MSDQLCNNIKNQVTEFNLNFDELRKDKASIMREKDRRNKDLLEELKSRMTREQVRANDLASMKGSSSWLNTIPLKSERFALNEREFLDAVNMRYK